MEIRLAKENELERVNELRKQVNDLHVEGRPDTFKPGFSKELQDYIKVIWNDPEQDIIVAVNEGTICGVAITHHIKKPENPFMYERDYLEIEEFCVDEAYRRNGAASQLISFIKTFAKEKGWESNQVLEFYGDEVLDFCVAKVLSEYYGYLRSEGDKDFDPREDYDEYITVDDMTEADLTDIKQKLVDNKMLAHRIELMGLQDYLYLGKGAEKQNVQNEENNSLLL